MKYYDGGFPCVVHFAFSNISTDRRINKNRQISYLNVTFNTTRLSYRRRETFIEFLREAHIQFVLPTSHKLTRHYKVIAKHQRPHVGRMNHGWRSASEAHTIYGGSCCRTGTACWVPTLSQNWQSMCNFYTTLHNFWGSQYKFKGNVNVSVAKIFWWWVISKREVLMAYREESHLYLQ
jgi:hypothetical protein